MLINIIIFSFCCVCFLSLVTCSQRYQKCEAYVDGERAIARSGYQYFYQIVAGGREEHPYVEVTFNVPLDPLPDAGGEQTFVFFERMENTNERRTCSINYGSMCNISYNATIYEPRDNHDDKLDTLSIEISLLSKSSFICFLSLEFALESQDIAGTASWKPHSDTIYEVEVLVESGYPAPSISSLECDGWIVNGTYSVGGRLLVSDIERLRNANCFVTLQNRISSKELSLPLLILPPLPLTTTPTTPSLPQTTLSSPDPAAESTVSSYVKIIIVVSLVAVIALIALIAVLVVCAVKHRGNKVNVTNQINMGSYKEKAELEDVESCVSIPRHEPAPEAYTDGTIDNISSNTSGIGDEVDGPGPSSSLDSSSDSYQHPIAETGATELRSSEPVQVSLTGSTLPTSCHVAIPSEEDDKFGRLSEHS